MRFLKLLPVFPCLLVLFAVAQTPAQSSLKYQQPPKAIVDLIDVLPTPAVSLSPATTSAAPRWLLIQQISGLPSINELAQPELRLAGLRFNPRTNGPSRGRYITALKLKELSTGKEVAVTGLPANPKIRFADWSPDAKKIAFAQISDATDNAGLSLWVVDVETARAQRVGTVLLNAVFSEPCEWMSNSQALLCKTIPPQRGPAPQRNEVPAGPVVQENLGRITPAATYEDLLKSPQDEQIFDYYAVSQLAVISLQGDVTPVGKPAVVVDASPSPDGNYCLVSERHHPYSYTLPFELFPQRISVTNLKTSATMQLADKPLQDTIPNVHDAVETGPREQEWRSDAPATVFWVETGDGGDPKKDVTVRDTLLLLDAPFDGTPRKLQELPIRFRSVAWSDNHLVLIDERRWNDRKRVILALPPGGGQAVKLFEGSFEDRYKDPGTPMQTANAAGKMVVQLTKDQRSVFLQGEGASDEGDKPFVAAMNLTNGESQRLWQSAPPYYEIPRDVLSSDPLTVLVRRESPEQSPNFYLWKTGAPALEQVTSFPNPYGDAPLPKKQVLKYKRADGVELSANLYLPPGYKPQDGPLPTLMEAYPTEYKTKSAAGQITGSPYEFVFLYWGSPVPFVTQGYAVLENASIPIVGEGKAEPNDTYVEQLVASAKAAIDEGVRLGVVDRNRVAVMGHSYGAFMTVNLLAHSDLFKAGIARSGAYNRTLTPFGFQNEDRTYWQAPDVYYKMSPFMHADQIKTPLLLIHGEADNNSGTFPIQSERLFSALKGQGATVRFVLLPLESHGYAARESVLHMFWEMNTWLNTYVKNAGATSTTTASH
jgi:dipeptidyl aminopeptidase/acylaminoacyl peptidase